MSIESISLSLSNKLGEKLDKTKEEINVLNYGMFIIIHTTVGIFMSLLVGILTGLPLEMMTVTITVAWFKKYSGGGHASTPTRCTVIGVLFALILSLLSYRLIGVLDKEYLIIFTIITMVVCYYIIYTKCPVASKYKQFKNDNSRNKIRKRAFRLAHFYTILLTILLIININLGFNELYRIIVPILLGILLQMLIITNKGSKLIKILDKLLENINIK